MTGTSPRSLDVALARALDDGTVSPEGRCLAAGKRIMAEVGYERASLTAIACEAGISQDELLKIFGSKSGLLQAIFDTAWAPLNSRLADIVMASLNTHDAVLAVLAAFLNILAKDPDLAHLLLFESRRQHGDNAEIRLSKGFRDFEHLLVSIFVRGQKDGSFSKSLEPKAMTSALMGAAEGMVRDRMVAEMLSQPEPFTESSLRSTFETMVTRLSP